MQFHSFNAEVKCYPISYKDGMYMLDGKKQFGNLKQLVEYYSKESCSCLHTRLRVPVSKEERLKCITEKEDFKRCENSKYFVKCFQPCLNALKFVHT